MYMCVRVLGAGVHFNPYSYIDDDVCCRCLTQHKIRLNTLQNYILLTHAHTHADTVVHTHREKPDTCRAVGNTFTNPCFL